MDLEVLQVRSVDLALWWLCPPLANISVQENIYENKIRCSSIILDIYMQSFPSQTARGLIDLPLAYERQQ